MTVITADAPKPRPRIYDTDDLRALNASKGGKFFSPDTMRHWRSRIHSKVYKGDAGVFFVTSEADYHGNRGYSVRRFDWDTYDVTTVGEVQDFASRGGAHAKAERCANGIEEWRRPWQVERDAREAAEVAEAAALAAD